ncbi:hypothetical protein QR680_014980 [Steinernema hermaphroditum]|uniref:CHK kinase-like domain-containing protein n=1 Tax=Steinernema hermaphroditum TaxID=289476 RepID=A0AA39ICA7_9BILA|nr:hypothetical protein QR680_014980 [Steinernema hermaphroditum]
MAVAAVALSSLPDRILDPVEPSEKIADSPFTVEWLLEALAIGDEKFQGYSRRFTVEKVTAADISQGKGFVSKVYNVSIEFDGLEKPYEVILKVPGTESIKEATSDVHGEEDRLNVNHIANVHNLECEFYTKYAPHIDIPVVKIFKTVEWILGEQPGAVLMESKVGSAASSPLWMGCSSQQMYTMAKSLASLMSYFLCLPQEQWIGKYNNEVFASVCEKEFFAPFYKKLVEMKPGMFDKGVEIFEKLTKSRKFVQYAMVGVAKEIGLPSVLSHGDLWANNVLWKKNPDGSLSNELAAIIDWQVIHEGSITNDLARFISHCVDGDVRREHEFQVLEYYYNTIVQLMREQNREVEFTYEQMKYAYKVNFVVQTMMVTVMGPFLFQEKDLSPVKKAQLDKILLRSQLAMEDALEYMKEMPADKLV